MERLIEQWEASDGGEFVELGSRLSDAFVNTPENFLSAMAAHPSTFDAWLVELPLTTFTAFQAGQAESLIPRLAKMRSTAATYRSHPRYGAMATRLAERLSTLSIREID